MELGYGTDLLVSEIKRINQRTVEIEDSLKKLLIGRDFNIPDGLDRRLKKYVGRLATITSVMVADEIYVLFDVYRVDGKGTVDSYHMPGLRGYYKLRLILDCIKSNG